jgi:hypothetical protein
MDEQWGESQTRHLRSELRKNYKLQTHHHYGTNNPVTQQPIQTCQHWKGYDKQYGKMKLKYAVQQAVQQTPHWQQRQSFSMIDADTIVHKYLHMTIGH